MKIGEIETHRISFEIENVRIYITLYGGFFNLYGAQSVIHNHNSYEFHLTLEGAAYLETESNKFTMVQSEGCVIAPGTVHKSIMGEQQSIKSSFCFSFEKLKRKTEQDIYEMFAKAFGEIDCVRKIYNAEKYTVELKQIMSEFYSEKTFSRYKIKNYFSLLLMNLAEELLPEQSKEIKTDQEDSMTSGAEKNLRRVMIEEYINWSYNKNISLAELSKILHLSQKQAARVFESEFGMGFQAYIMKFRTNVAIHLLCNTDMSVSEIAGKVGYQSYNGFYKLFLSQTGQTPQAYRN